MPLFFVALLVPQTLDIDVVVQLKKGESVAGLSSAQFRMKTSFGTANVLSQAVSKVTFGQPDVLTTTDGTVLKGTLRLTELKVRTADGDVTVTREQLVSLNVIQRADAIPGKVSFGRAANGMTYMLRPPKNFDAGKPASAIVILHGSNMNSKAYVNTLVNVWPDIAERYVLIGINGEQKSQAGSAEDPRFNYTYVNYAGRSKYQGFPGTDRESPALVPEVLSEIKETLKLDRIFVGGHSQGGFLTYSLVMNSPDLFAGAFPISGGMIVQAEPTAFADTKLRAQQRKVPIAIVHGRTDPSVSYQMAEAAHASLADDGFSMLRLFPHETAGHGFSLLPVKPAILWLETMTERDPAALISSAEVFLKQKNYRDVVAVIRRATALDESGQHKTKLQSLREAIKKAAQPEADRLLKLVQANADGTWVDDYLKFRKNFEFADSAKPLRAAYAKLRAEHQGPADKLYAKARADFQANKTSAAYLRYQQVVERYYASSWYPKMKQWIADKKK